MEQRDQGTPHTTTTVEETGRWGRIMEQWDQGTPHTTTTVEETGRWGGIMEQRDQGIPHTTTTLEETGRRGSIMVLYTATTVEKNELSKICFWWLICRVGHSFFSKERNVLAFFYVL